MKKLGTKTLETERLLLRSFKLEDAENVFNNYASSDEVTKFLRWPTHASLDVTKDFLTSIVKNNDDLNTYDWAIVLKENNQVIGSIAVVDLQANRNQVEIGYVLGKEYWNKGIMTEALKKVISFFIEEVKVNKVVVACDTRNLASGKVATKANMELIEVTIQDGKNNSGVCDIAHYEFKKPRSSKRIK